MASKSFNVEPIGIVSVYKRRGTRKVNLKVAGHKVRVTQPPWLPYNTGLQFAIKNKFWILEQIDKQPRFALYDGFKIGKDHILKIEKSDSLRTRVKAGLAIVYLPNNLNMSDDSVIKSAKNAIKRALKIEAKKYLEPRLDLIADKYGFSYTGLNLKPMKSRWGSCNSEKKITLNIYLLMLPWNLIDYVLLHELAHTKHLHHGPAFWNSISQVMPDFKLRRKELKQEQQSINLLH
jgi:hypothetical protein